MIQCKDCEHFRRGADGKVQLLCDPFANIKEPECLAKQQFVTLRSLAEAYETTVEMYRRLAPLQERMFRHMEQELDEAEDADSWKQGYDPDDDEDDDSPRPAFPG